MVNGLQLYQQYRGNEQEMGLRQEAAAREAEGSGLRNQMMRFQFAQAQEQAQRQRQQQNMLAQAVQSGNPNALMMADPKLAFQMQQMRSREQMMRERMQGQERMGRDRITAQERMSRERQNQPIWDAERGVFIQRPQPGMSPPGGGIIAPPNLPPKRNPEAEKIQAKAAASLPDALNQGEMALKQIDEMIGSEDGTIKEHAGFQNAVGMPNVITGLGARAVPGMFPGSDTASFVKRLDQIKGGAFLQAFESLKGGGQITEVEGKKATEAITRMDQAQSEKEFKAAAREFQAIIRKGMETARKMAAGGGKPGASPATGGGAGGFDMSAIDAELKRRQGR